MHFMFYLNNCWNIFWWIGTLSGEAILPFSFLPSFFKAYLPSLRESTHREMNLLPYGQFFSFKSNLQCLKGLFKFQVEEIHSQGK